MNDPTKKTARPRVLLIDDDENLLKGLVRLHGRKYDLTTASRAVDAIQMVQNEPAFAVVVCDYQMPGIKGSACLAKIQSFAPDTVRVLLTGNNDLATAVDAINRGAIFRFLNKPCDDEVFERCIHDAVRQHELLRSERDLLQNTLQGSVRVMAEILSLSCPAAFGRAGRVHAVVQRLARKRGIAEPWEVETAAMLFEIGWIAMPEGLLDAVAAGSTLTTEQRAMVGRHPAVGSDLLRHVPRLEGVAEIVRYQAKHFDGSGLPTDSKAGEQIHVGARMLAAAIEFCDLRESGKQREAALHDMAEQSGRFDPSVLQDLAEIDLPEDEMQAQKVSVRDLRPGYYLQQDIVHASGTLIVPKGQTITPSMLARLRTYADLGHIDFDVEVMVPNGEAVLR